MLTAIVRFALRFRGVVVALATALVIWGLLRLERAPYDVFPEFAPPQVILQTEAPGLVPEQVELLVTQPLESALAGLSGVERLHSGSIEGLSVVTLTFDPRRDPVAVRQEVAERLATVAGQLPSSVRPPAMTPLTSSASVLLVVGLTSEQRSLRELRTLADWTLKPRLLAVPGVAKVAVYGSDVRQIQVRLQPARLVRYGLSLDEVSTAVRAALDQRGAGFSETASQRIELAVPAGALPPGELAKAVVAHHAGRSVTLGDLGVVEEGSEPAAGGAAIDGRPGVALVLSGQYGANTLATTERLDRELADLAPELARQGVTLHPALFRAATFVTTAIANVRSALLLGAVLVIVVLFLFLLDLRAAAISCTAIPLSLLAAVVVLERLGHSLDTMTLGGLAIAVGEVVDDAVIDVENILRRLRENARRAVPEPARRVVLAASLEVRGAVVYATFAVALVFVPVLTLPGVAGRLFGPLGLAYILAVMASLAVALTVTPALCLALLRGRVVGRDEPRWLAGVKQRYTRLLTRLQDRGAVALAGSAALGVAALALLIGLGGQFLPELREGHYIIHLALAPGASLGESLRLGASLERQLRELPFVRAVVQRTGRAEKADDIMGVHYSEVEVDLVPLHGAEARRAAERIRTLAERFPGAQTAVKTFLTERVEETISGYTAELVVNLFGDDLEVLDEAAARAAGVIRTLPGARDVQIQAPAELPRWGVRPRAADLARVGLTGEDVLATVEAAFQGHVVGEAFVGNRPVEVAVRLEPAASDSLAALGALPIRNGEGRFVALREVADLYPDAGRYAVLHEGGRRVEPITCNVRGRDVAALGEEIRRRLAAPDALPPGVHAELAGTAAAQAESRHDLLWHSALATLGIVLLLSLVLRPARNLGLVLVNLPFALVGGVAAVALSGEPPSLGSLVGFVTLFGLSLRNSIMLVAHYQHLVEAEGWSWGPAAALRGAAERFVPIVMTALVTGLGLLPLALGRAEPGREIEGPMAMVILGGLATSTVLNLLVLPSLCLRFGRFAASAEGEEPA